MHIVLITGISGSGKSVALNVLEDTGYYCVDNLPPALLPSLVQTLLDEGTPQLAVAVDARSAESLASLDEHLADELVQIDADALVLLPRGQLMMRSVAMAFDAYLGEGQSGRFSRTV